MNAKIFSKGDSLHFSGRFYQITLITRKQRQLDIKPINLSIKMIPPVEESLYKTIVVSSD